MKNFNRALCAIFAFVVAITMGACTNPDLEGGPTTYNVVVDKPTAMGAYIDVTVRNIKEFAYYLTDDELPAAAILAGGKVVKIDNTKKLTKKRVEIDGLKTNSAYNVLFAFRADDETILPEVKSVQFVTTDYGDPVTIVEKMYNGVKIQITMPDEVKERGNALRYAIASMPMYNYAKQYEKIEPEMLLNNAMQYTTKDKLVIYDEEHNYERDENGEVIENGAEYADPQVPGEPGYFLIGEYEYMNDTEARIVVVDGETKVVNDDSYWDDTIWTYPAGWDFGYYNPKYNWAKYLAERGTPAYNSESYWTGYYERIPVHTLEPEICGSIDIKVTDKTPIDACVAITPSEEVESYTVMIMQESEYQTQFLPLIENNEEYVRWMVGSYFAMMSWGSGDYFGDAEIWLKGWFTDTKGLDGHEVRVMVAGRCDDAGTKQCFATTKFTLPEVTQPKPQIKVTPLHLEDEDAYTLRFNIKNMTPDNPITEAYYACNYVREFDIILKSYTYTSLIKELCSTNKFNAAELEQINSAEGFTFEMSSRESTTSRIAVLAYNWEGTANDLDATASPAVAEFTTRAADFKPRVNNSLFTELAGEWVASAPMKSFEVVTDEDGNATGEYTYTDAGTYTSDVTIYGEAGLPYSTTVPQEVYDIYTAGGVSREETKKLYDELVELTELYNARTRGFNRLLCLGFNFAIPDLMLGNVATPYQLFTASDYSASKVEYMFYDFGPKWNLEIDADGSVWLPIDYENENPLSAWCFSLDKAFYIMGVHDLYVIAKDIRFPVEVSADRNTLTIKPYVYTDEAGKSYNYYPCISYIENGSISTPNPRIQGDIVLTRKTGAAKATANNYVSAPAMPVRTLSGEVIKPKARNTLSMTSFEPENFKHINRIERENKIEPGVEAFHKRASECVRTYFGIK